MSQLFEYIDSLNSPYEAFWVDSHRCNDPPRTHWHYYMEIIYIEIGSVQVDYDQKHILLHAGDFMLFHPRVIHMVYPVNTEDYLYGVIKFDISRLNSFNIYSQKLRPLFDNAKTCPACTPYFFANQLSGLQFKQLFSTCIQELNGKNYGYDMIVHSAINTLLVRLLRIWRSLGPEVRDALSAVSELSSVETITEYIDEHSADPLRVEDLAERCNMSYSYFAKNFKQVYGRSCKEYIEFIRICKAEDLLLFTDYDLSYISQETGFSDCSHLIKIFKKLKGITPKQYKLRRTDSAT